MAIVELRNVTGDAGDGRSQRPLTLRIGDGELMALLGPPGAGKSRILRMVAGLEPLAAGSLQIGSRAVETLLPGDRDVAMVFSEPTLYAYKTARANIEFPLRARRVARAARLEQVSYIAAQLGLTDVLDARPGALDDEQRLRVALARALVRSPQLLLLDDSFSALKRRARERSWARLRAVQRQMRITTLLAGDDAEEAMFLADRIAVLRDGEIAQVDTPTNLYRRPAHAFVASLVGSPPMNLFPATYRAGSVIIDEQKLEAPATWQAVLADGATLLVGVRPETFEIGGAPRNRIGAVLDPTSRVVLGSRILLAAQVGKLAAAVELPGDTFDLPRHAFARLEQAHLFARDSGERLID
jgi:multiple sugar transport system ATP-binding protein